MTRSTFAALGVACLLLTGLSAGQPVRAGTPFHGSGGDLSEPSRSYAASPGARQGNLAPARLPLSLPPAWEDRVIFYNAFERADGLPEINTARLEITAKLEASETGMRGHGARTGKGHALHLRGPELSAHRPLTVSFWWALREDADKTIGFGLLHLSGRGYVSHFIRSGPWCGLDRPAAVLQVYNLPDIHDVNDIYDREIQARGDLKADVWHHTAVVFSAASVVTVYTDGRKVCETRLTGRAFLSEDKLQDLAIGDSDGPPLLLDEVVILNRPLSAAEIAEYVLAIRQMRRADYPI